MKRILSDVLLPIACCLLPSFSFSQNCSSLNITHQADIASTCNKMVVTMIHDKLNRPYLYVANKEAGLTIYDITTVSTPTLVATVPISFYDSLHVMNVEQDGNYLYLALGNQFATSKAGLAIVNVSNPASPSVTNYWELPNSIGGAGVVKVEGNYAYLGAMVHGLVILDISNKNSIQFVSKFLPNKYFPPIANPDTTKINSRGLEVKNSIVYLCHDAGGVRIINCTNKSAPVETGRFCNPVMYTPLNRPRAYNNLVLDDTLIYVAVDYCGIEVLNIADTSNITLVGWWNPYNCPNNNWFSSPVHANEIHYDKNCKHIFLSTGKSDMVVVDVSNPALPDSCNYYGGVSNNIGTWGAGLYQNQIYLSYICTLGIPFASNWTGVKILTYTPCATGIEEFTPDDITIYPVPSGNIITIESKQNLSLSEVMISNVLGQTFSVPYNQSEKKLTIDVSLLREGLYFLRAKTNEKEVAKTFIKGPNE